MRCGLAGWLMALVLLACCPASAHADEPRPLPQPTAAGANAVGACLAAGEVWLIVSDEVGTIHANQCVGTPRSGEQALADGGMRLEFGRSRLVCTIDGHPDTCPANFTGQYWHYYHALPGQPWTYSQQGAGSRTPPAGSLEGWCYNSNSEDSCTPPQLLITQSGAVVAPPGVAASDLADPPVMLNAPVPHPTGTPWELILAATALVAVAALAWWWRRHPSSGEAEPGGR